MPVGFTWAVRRRRQPHRRRDRQPRPTSRRAPCAPRAHGTRSPSMAPTSRSISEQEGAVARPRRSRCPVLARAWRDEVGAEQRARVEPVQLGDALDHALGARGRRFAAQPQQRAEQRVEPARQPRQHLGQPLGALRRGEVLVAQAQVLAAQLVLALQPQVRARHLDAREHVLALEQQVALDQVEPLDREDVERREHLVARHEQGIEVGRLPGCRASRWRAGRAPPDRERTRHHQHVDARSLGRRTRP